jgi:putative FmdB family regulatory protein
MPIYAYRCDSCGVEKDVLQKLSDAPLTVCPDCGASAFNKRLSAPAFQLKGSGWYVTDFRDGGRKAKAEGADGVAGDAKAEGKAEGKARSTAGDGQRSDAGQAAPAAAATPGAAAAATPATPAAPEGKQA